MTGRAAGRAVGPDGASASDDAAPALLCEDLVYAYPGAPSAVLRGVDLRLERGEIVGLLGPSGSGKSTLQKILIGVAPGYGGAARLFDQEAAAWALRRDGALQERIGVSFELPNHYARLTARENLALFAALYARPSDPPETVLGELGLSDAIDRRVGDFSKGMLTRLTLARALQHRPELLILDEPTSGLDPTNVDRVRRAIRARRDAGAAVLLATHDMELADGLCDRAALLVDGRIAVADTPRALKLAHGRRRLRLEHRPKGAGDRGAPILEEFPLEGLAVNAAFHAVLSGSQVETLHSREATLSEVFVAVAQAARGESAPPPEDVFGEERP